MKHWVVVNGITDEQTAFGEYGTAEDGTLLRLDEFSLPADSAGPEEHRVLVRLVIALEAIRGLLEDLCLVTGFPTYRMVPSAGELIDGRRETR